MNDNVALVRGSHRGSRRVCFWAVLGRRKGRGDKCSGDVYSALLSARDVEFGFWVPGNRRAQLGASTTRVEFNHVLGSNLVRPALVATPSFELLSCAAEGLCGLSCRHRRAMLRVMRRPGRHRGWCWMPAEGCGTSGKLHAPQRHACKPSWHPGTWEPSSGL